MSKVQMLGEQIMCHGWVPIESTKNNVAEVFLVFLF